MIDIEQTMQKANAEMERLKDAEFVLNFPLLKIIPIISSLQLSLRHPQMPEPTGTVVRKFVDETLGVIERASPDLAAFLRLGDNQKYDRPAPAGDKIRKLAEKVAADLFVNGEGREAKRLVMEFDKKFSGGGWCRTAVVDRVETVLRQK